LSLHELRKDRRMHQKQLASLLNVDPSYLSGLESGRKGPPPPSMVQRVKDALCLSENETAALERAAHLSRRKVEIPVSAEPEEYEMVYSVIDRIGQLRPAQVRAIREILKI
jgi:HTH-type transcriptional regulator, competence development regulator